MRLHFADDQSWKAGMRPLNVDVNGSRAFTNYDIFASAGVLARANVANFNSAADSSGNIKVVIALVVGNALLNGIELIP